MNTLLRALIVWLLMLALPYQGMAAAAMVACAPLPAPLQAIPAPAVHTVHTVHEGARPPCHEGRATPDSARQPEQQGGTHHGGAAKCATCAACGIAAALPAAFPPFVPAPPQGLSAPAPERVLPSVHPDQPERPPRFLLA